MHLSTIPRLSATGDSLFVIFFCISYHRELKGIKVCITSIPFFKKKKKRKISSLNETVYNYFKTYFHQVFVFSSFHLEFYDFFTTPIVISIFWFKIRS